MDTYLARQPIFNRWRKVVGYELLYRDGVYDNRAVFVDGPRATSRVLSDAITVFGLNSLTNGTPAYINFPDELVYNDFALLTNPEEIVIELLEDIKVTQNLIEKIGQLKEKGYRIALDDYVGGRHYDPLLPMVDIVKVDFMLTSYEQQKTIAARLKSYRNLTLLAEKVETMADFSRAKACGYEFYQGYFFAKPDIMRRKIPALSSLVYVRLLAELNRNSGVNFDTCASIIYSDAALTYRLFHRVQTVYYYRGNPIKAIKQALILLGTSELRSWVILAMARECNVTWSDELIRQANLRGVFARNLMRLARPDLDAEEGFLLGMFSMLDQIMGISMHELLMEIKFPPELERALLDTGEDFYSNLINYVLLYETGNSKLLLPDLGLPCSERDVFIIYMESVQETDEIFNALEGGG